MAGNILIRKLSPEVNESLERFKDESGIGTNSQATIRMIVRYYERVEESDRLYKENTELAIKYKKLKLRVESYMRNRASMEEDLKYFNEIEVF